MNDRRKSPRRETERRIFGREKEDRRRLERRIGERRKVSRIKAEFLVICKVDEVKEVHLWMGNREIGAVMVDLSPKGMSIITENDISVSSLIQIKFTLINEDAISDEDRVRSMRITGKVRSNVLTEKGEYRLGISFAGISREDALCIEKLSGAEQAE